MSFSERLRTALKNRNINQSILAYRIGVDRSTVSNYLSGRFTAKTETIIKIAKVLNVSPQWLAGFDVPMNGLEPTPEEDISEDKRLLLELFDRVPDEQKQMVLNMIKAALGKE
jgi:transcriptional regulator with XRE-family HTH domain